MKLRLMINPYHMSYNTGGKLNYNKSYYFTVTVQDEAHLE